MNILSSSKLVVFLCPALLLCSVGCDSGSVLVPEEDAALSGFSDASSARDGGSSEGSSRNGGTQIPPGQLTVGEWQDLDNWNFWLSLFDQEQNWPSHQSKWGLHTSERYQVKVLHNGSPAGDVAVLLRNNSGTTVFSARTRCGGYC